MGSVLESINSGPAGAWAIGVSGGADSVALLHLLHARTEVALHVVHLNHQTRGEASDGDATFVADLAARLQCPCIIAKRCDLESQLPALPTNRSARYRCLRHRLFASVVNERNLRGVALAHHADDQAETVLQRLLRGSSWPGLCGMAEDTQISGLRLVRPLLNIRSDKLRQFLRSQGETWREDASNQSGQYQRNRVRKLLLQKSELTPALLDLATTARALRSWTKDHAHALSAEFSALEIVGRPIVLTRESIAGWLRERGVPGDAISPEVVERVTTMCTDAATPPRIMLPGEIMLQRRRGRISASRVSKSATAASPRPARSQS